MSGFEVAGIVLAAVPIIVGALEEYKKVKSIWRRCRIMSAQIDDMIEALLEQKVLIQHRLDILFRDIGVFEPRTKTTPYRELLSSEEVADKLREYLGNLYDPFKWGLRRCERNIWQVAKSIRGLTTGIENLPQGLEELVNTTPVTSEGKYTFRAKLKFGLRYEDTARQISELKASFTELRELLKDGKEFNNSDLGQSSSRIISKFSQFLRRVRGHASGLYPAIVDAWSESCHAEHQTKLFLQSRPELLSNKRKAPLIFFNIVFESTSDSAVDCLKLLVDIEPLEDDQELEPLDHRVPSIRFHDIENKPRDIGPLSGMKSICDSLQQAQDSKQLVKVYLCGQKLSKRLRTPITDIKVVNEGVEYASRAASLKDLLTSPSSPWSLRQRATLAFDLASSLLQLHATPWLPDDWNKNSVFFPRSEDGDIVFTRPFIQNDFSQPRKLKNLNKLGPRLDARKALLELGITLLEVWERSTLELYSEQKDLTLDATDGRRREIAKIWFDEVACRMVPSYIDAVERCLECCLPTKSTFPDWQDKMFQESVCDGIIKPLWDTSDHKPR